MWKNVSKQNKSTSFVGLIDKIFGDQSHSNITRWIRDAKVKPQQFNSEKWSKDVSKWCNVEERVDLFSNSVRASEFANVLGMSRAGSRYLFDKHYIAHHDMISSLVYSEERVESVISAICGLYRIHILRKSAAVECISGALSIRYFIPLPRGKKNEYLVRCKMIFRSDVEHRLGRKDNVVDYDGYVSYGSNSSMTFVFESRPFHGENRIMCLSVSSKAEIYERRAFFVGGYVKSTAFVNCEASYGQAAIELIESNKEYIRNDDDIYNLNIEQYNHEHMMIELLSDTEVGRDGPPAAAFLLREDKRVGDISSAT